MHSRNSANHGIYLLESQRLGEGEFWFLEFREFGVDIWGERGVMILSFFNEKTILLLLP